MNVIRATDYNDMSNKACTLVIDRLKKLSKPILGLATGSTPEGLYEKLIDSYQQKEISFKDVTTFNLDEYVGLDENHPNSYHYFMNEHLFKHIDIAPDKTFVPDGVAADLQSECESYEQLIKDAGGIDLQILGIGTNGHIAFNEPGTKFDSRTSIVDLARDTLDANVRFFSSIKEVPTKAITMGIGTVMEAREIIMLVSGEGKAEALSKIINGEVTEEVPASILQKHSNVTIIADEAALSKVE